MNLDDFERRILMSKKLVMIENDRVLTTSLKVADTFDKPHNDVMKSVRKLISEIDAGKISPVKMFDEASYVDKKGEQRPMYYMNRDGFTLLAMGFTGKKALEFKIKYIDAFNRMEEKLKELLAAGKNALWQASRQQTKDTYKDLGTVKKLFIEYARYQGYTGEDKYIYSTLAIKANQFVGLPKRNGRDTGTIPQLNVLSFIENGMCELIIQGMDEDIHYTRIIAKVDIWLDKFRKENFVDSYLNMKLLN